MFFTRINSGLHRNPHFNRRVRGDVYLLKVSEIEDQDKRRFYEDLKPDMPREELKDLHKQFFDWADQCVKGWS